MVFGPHYRVLDCWRESLAHHPVRLAALVPAKFAEGDFAVMPGTARSSSSGVAVAVGANEYAGRRRSHSRLTWSAAARRPRPVDRRATAPAGLVVGQAVAARSRGVTWRGPLRPGGIEKMIRQPVHRAGGSATPADAPRHRMGAVVEHQVEAVVGGRSSPRGQSARW